MLNGKYKQQHQMMLLRKIDKETYIDISDKLWNHVLKKKKKKVIWSWAYFRYW